MHTLARIIPTFALFSTALSAALPAAIHEVTKYAGKTTGRYIVQLKDGKTKEDVINADLLSAVTHDYHIINGFAIDGSDDVLNTVLKSQDVASVSEDGVMYTSGIVTQINAPWGLSRVSASKKLSSTDASALTYSYKYDDRAGAGVDVYIVDTGIRVTHKQFEGRASWGKTFGGYADADGNGHGTHCAGTVASKQFGVAKEAHVIAVKVLSDEGSGSTSDIISGLEYVMDQAKATGRPTVASMSLGGSADSPLDNAVKALTDAGIHVVVAAGNDGTDASFTSPARAPSAITVGATDIQDSRGRWSLTQSSNYGSVVDIWAPGTDVISTWNTSDTATQSETGTSMATPHVAGLIAYFISMDGNSTPGKMAYKIKSRSQKGVITGIPPGTINDFVHNARS